MLATSIYLPSWAPSRRLLLPSRCLTCHSHGLEYQHSSYPSPYSSTKFYLINPNGQNLHSASASQSRRAKILPRRADDVGVCATQRQAFRTYSQSVTRSYKTWKRKRILKLRGGLSNCKSRAQVSITADLTNIPHSLLVRPMQIGESEPWDCLVTSLDSVFRFAGRCSTFRN